MLHGEPLNTVKFARSVEAFFELIFKLIGIGITYIFLNSLLIMLFKENGHSALIDSYGLSLFYKENQSEDLINLLIFPALYVLKDSYKIFEPYRVFAYMRETDVTVVSGILTKRTDKLKIENLENIELVQTPFGHWNYLPWEKYGTLNLHVFGGLVVIPYLEEPEAIQLKIEKNLSNIKESQ